MHYVTIADAVCQLSTLDERLRAAIMLADQLQRDGAVTLNRARFIAAATGLDESTLGDV
jgi:hypothetical protein